jgi:hypothetical protein
MAAGQRLDEEAVTRFSENEFDAWRMSLRTDSELVRDAAELGLS